MTVSRLEEVSCAVCGSDEQVAARIRTRSEPLGEACRMPSGRSRWVVCTRCGLVYQSPRPTQVAVNELYEGGAYHADRGGVPEHYIAYSLRRSVPALEWALGQIGHSTGRALDIGCGVGGALVHLRRRGWDTVGVEPDAHLGAVGRSRWGLDIRDGFFTGATFPAGEGFDLAYSCHVWEHLVDPVSVARLAHGHLAGDRGWLCIVVPTFRRARTMAWNCFAAAHTYMFTDVSLGNVLSIGGFEVVSHTYEADADSELWVLARAVEPTVSPAIRREDAGRIQRELSLVPLRAPLGLPGRARKHLGTLLDDPKDFAARTRRHIVRRVR